MRYALLLVVMVACLSCDKDERDVAVTQTTPAKAEKPIATATAPAPAPPSVTEKVAMTLAAGPTTQPAAQPAGDAELPTLREAVKRHDAEILALKKEIADLRAAIAAKDSQYESLAKKVDELQGQIDRAKQNPPVALAKASATPAEKETRERVHTIMHNRYMELDRKDSEQDIAIRQARLHGDPLAEFDALHKMGLTREERAEYEELGRRLAAYKVDHPEEP